MPVTSSTIGDRARGRDVRKSPTPTRAGGCRGPARSLPADGRLPTTTSTGEALLRCSTATPCAAPSSPSARTRCSPGRAPPPRVRHQRRDVESRASTSDRSARPRTARGVDQPLQARGERDGGDDARDRERQPRYGGGGPQTPASPGQPQPGQQHRTAAEPGRDRLPTYGVRRRRRAASERRDPRWSRRRSSRARRPRGWRSPTAGGTPGWARTDQAASGSSIPAARTIAAPISPATTAPTARRRARRPARPGSSPARSRHGGSRAHGVMAQQALSDDEAARRGRDHGEDREPADEHGARGEQDRSTSQVGK